jgi:hypothetical protein
MKLPCEEGRRRRGAADPRTATEAASWRERIRADLRRLHDIQVSSDPQSFGKA